jgi:hypothetical protein
VAQRAVYLADYPAGCAIELAVGYAAPEALATHLLFEITVDAPLVDLREVLRRHGATLADLTEAMNYRMPRQVAARLRTEPQAGAVVPGATVARAFNVVIYPDVWNDFVIGEAVPLAVASRLLRRLRAARTPRRET